MEAAMADFFVSTLGPRGARQENALDWSRLLARQEAGARESWTIPEAFVAVLFAATTCDGELSEVEHEELLALVHRSRALKSLSRNELAEINTTVVARLRDADTALQEACKALPEEMRLPLFAHALDLVLADGELTQEEAEFLDSIVLYLGIDRDSVERVSNVIALKNRF
jgi:uncharacterized tellurite resistance protein B-like protein